MCPRPGMILNMTATKSLAFPSAVCVALRTQSQRSQRSAFFGRRCPQYGHAILSPLLCSGAAVGASVYSTFILLETHNSHRIRQANRIGTMDHTDVIAASVSDAVHSSTFAASALSVVTCAFCFF